jgi:hypothetical protein
MRRGQCVVAALAAALFTLVALSSGAAVAAEYAAAPTTSHFVIAANTEGLVGAGRSFGPGEPARDLRRSHVGLTSETRFPVGS